MKIITAAIIFAAGMASNVSYGSYLMAVTLTCSASTSQSGVSSAQSYVVYASGSRGTTLQAPMTIPPAHRLSQTSLQGICI